MSLKICESYITISGLRVYARHGVLPTERLVGNDFTVDAVLYYNAAKAMEDDEISEAVNYAEAVKIIRQTMSQSSRLLEHVTGRIIRALTAAFPAVTHGSVTVTKLSPPIPAQLSGASFTATFAVK